MSAERQGSRRKRLHDDDDDDGFAAMALLSTTPPNRLGGSSGSSSTLLSVFGDRSTAVTLTMAAPTADDPDSGPADSHAAASTAMATSTVDGMAFTYPSTLATWTERPPSWQPSSTAMVLGDTSPTPPPSHHNSSPSTVAIVGGTLGSALGVAVGVAVVFFLVRRRRRRRQAHGDGDAAAAAAEKPPTSRPYAVTMAAGTALPAVAPPAPQPVIVARGANGAYFTGIDTSDQVSVHAAGAAPPNPFADPDADEPPPPYRPRSVPPLSRETSVSARAPPGSSRTHLLGRGSMAPTSLASVDDDHDAVSAVSAASEGRRAGSAVSELSYQDDPVIGRPTV